MRFLIYLQLDYFCCSALPLLNGDIKLIIDRSIQYDPRSLDLTLQKILRLLKEQYEVKKMPRNLRKEYKRMIALYRYRIRMFDDLGGLK